jgi:dipeptidyl aminopeptidase/acylaminoacyl peptidase
MRRLILLAWFAAVFAGRAAAQPIELAELLSVRDIKAVQVSPDGGDLAYIVSIPELKANRVRTELWITGAKSEEPRRLAAELEAIEKVLWSPRGDELAVLGRADGKTSLWVVDPVDGKTRRLTDVDRSNHYLAHQGASLCWSPNGKSLAYLAADRASPPKEEPLVVDRIQYKTRTSFSDNRRTHIFIIDVASGTTRQLTSGNFDEHSIDWSSRGEIVFCSNRGADPDASLNNDLYVVAVADGTVTQLTGTPGNEMAPAWSPDGKQLAYTMTRRAPTTIDSVAEDDHVWVLDRASGATRDWTADLDRRCAQPRWFREGLTLSFLARDRGTTQIFSAPRSGKAVRPHLKLAGAVTSYSFAASGSHGAFVFSNPIRPPELYTFSLRPQQQRTHLNDELLKRWPLVTPQDVHAKSPDGTPVHGWLMVPPGASADHKAPVLLFIHGGPHSMHGLSFSPTFQILCSRGYAILALNPRGSSGYGQAFADGCLNDWGGGDYQDLMAGLDHALATHPELDPKNLGVTGGSYGGYMTNWVITRTDRFKAAVSYAGLSNLISFYATSLYQDLIHVEFGGPPWERAEILWERSPLKHIARAKTPTLILHGEADNDVHITQSEELYTALRRLGVETVFVRYPREGHGASEPRFQVDQLERTAAWFDRHLKAR